MNTAAGRERLDWLDPLKAFALVGILLNHLVEQFGPGPWFTNPSNDWPDLATRLHTWPAGPAPIAVIRWLGWLGDATPGVFILASGVGLTYAALHRPRSESAPASFFKRRILRLYPLYIAMHLVIMAAAMMVPDNTLSLAGPKTLLSLLGLRFTPDLFFYISPSWWFVWLILQLYLVFPLLYALLERVGVRWFLLITCAVTFASRAFGILHSGSLYFWMTGLFFGTRLAEFAAGMAIASLISAGQADPDAAPSAPRALLGGALLYLSGFAASLLLLGSIVSNLLVTLGLSALFYAAWTGIVRRHATVARMTQWVGAASYAVFLLHQPPLMWTSAFASHGAGVQLAAALAVLALSFPLGSALNRGVEALMGARPGRGAPKVLRLLSLVTGVGVCLALVLVEPRLYWGTLKHHFFSLVLGGSLAVLSYLEWNLGGADRGAERVVRRAALLAGVVTLFVFPPGLGTVAVVFALLLLALCVPASLVTRAPLRSWALAAGLGAVVVAPVELILRRYAPLEAGQWGERPALEAHPTRVYGLRPNQVTRLRYNDYDYVVRANSQGLASPEIAAPRPTPDALRVLVVGDAFSMPEGLPYERSYPAFLQNVLSRCLSPRIVQVINGGVTGYGPPEEAAQLRELAPLYRPDVVVYQFFINEFSDVDVSAEERRLEIGLQGHSKSQGVWAVRRSQIVARIQWLRAAIAERVSARPSAGRVWKSLLEYYRTGDNPLYSQSNLDTLRAYLAQMNETARGAGARMVIYFVPGAVAVEKPSDIAYFPFGEDLTDTSRYDLGRPIRSLRTLTDPLGIAVVDLTPSLKAHAQRPVYFPTAWHWNEEGHRAVALTMAESLAEQGYLGATARDPGCRASAEAFGTDRP